MFKKIISLLMVVVLSVCVCSFAPITNAATAKEQIAELEKKQQAIKNQIASLQNDINKQEKLKKPLQDQIDNLQAQIDIYNNEITGYENEISKLREQQGKIESDLQTKKDLFLKRVRALYISGSTNTQISILLGADDFSNFLYQDQVLESITKYDNKIMEDLRKDIEDLEKVKNGINDKKAEAEKVKATVVSKQSVLNDAIKQYNTIIGKLEDKKDDLNDTLKNYQNQIDNLEKEIGGAINNSSSSSIKYDGSKFKWPCPNYYYISSPFGPRWGRNHNGVDIAGSAIYGKPIVASADGQVSLASYNSGGYGNYVMINHGKDSSGTNYTTLYAHMSSRAVSTGQWVTKGQIIGYVGSTGYSTGPHLHFEIRVNGTPKNPLNWFNNF
ncbi:MAG: peptidoglycan DD-metalloendopeptidase family protein [Clostridia bacterium]|nr:peptidoglycan DD-metalloendopeptidase family protein [Clostridia bacterium]